VPKGRPLITQKPSQKINNKASYVTNTLAYLPSFCDKENIFQTMTPIRTCSQSGKWIWAQLGGNVVKLFSL